MLKEAGNRALPGDCKLFFSVQRNHESRLIAEKFVLQAI